MKKIEKEQFFKYKKPAAYVYMAVLTLIVSFFASKIYKTDDLIWPRERYIIVATMVICFYMVLIKLWMEKYISIQKTMYIYHFILLAPMLIMALPMDDYELRPLYLVPMFVVLMTDFSLGIVTGIAVILSTSVMIFTNLAEFTYIALIIMVLGCYSVSQIHNLRRFLVFTLIFWAGTFYLCGLYRYFSVKDPAETFQFRFAAIAWMVAASVSVIVFIWKYWIFFLRIHDFASENSDPLEDMKKNSLPLYYHSLEVGKLSRTLAAAIGANIRLCYAAGLHHDIGKLSGSNDVKEMLVKANEYGIPRNIKSIMVECTGKYRRPASKESAIVMLADSVITSLEYVRENNQQIEDAKLVEHIISTRVLNGSFRQSNLNMEELDILRRICIEKVTGTKEKL